MSNSKIIYSQINTLTHNEAAWDHQALLQHDWSKPVSSELIEEARRDPFAGKGKPEPLKYEYSGYWSRRITEEHRLIYSVSETAIEIISCKYHYR